MFHEWAYICIRLCMIAEEHFLVTYRKHGIFAILSVSLFIVLKFCSRILRKQEEKLEVNNTRNSSKETLLRKNYRNLVYKLNMA